MIDRWVLVTGGAGGIGEALCAQLHEANFRPIIGYFSQEVKAKHLAENLNGIAIQINLLEPSQIVNSVASLKGKNIVAVVLNASLSPKEQKWQEQSQEDLLNHWQASVVGNQILLRELVTNFFKSKRQGIVIGILSKALAKDEITMEGISSYLVAKAGLRALLQAIKLETRWLKIKTISPDFTETPMLSIFDPRMIELLKEQGKLSKPEEVAKAIVSEILNEKNI